MKELVSAAKAFADPTRIRIMMALREQELCVCELADALSLTQSTLSTHLQVIRSSGLVTARKEGKWMYYAIASGAKRLVKDLFNAFSESLEADSTLRRDGKRLSRRLSLRDNGACCVGFAGTKTCCASKKQ